MSMTAHAPTAESVPQRPIETRQTGAATIGAAPRGRVAGSIAEVAQYVATSVGMALACSGYAMLGDLRRWLAGPWLLAAVAAGALLCLGIALSIAELASLYPSAPGVRTYLRKAFGDRLSLTLTFLTFGVLALFAGVESAVFVATVRPLLGGIPDGVVMTGLVVMLVAINLMGLDLPRRTQLLLTAVAVALVGGLAAWVLGTGDRHPAPLAAATAPDPATFVAAVGGAIFLYTGFEWVTPLGRGPAAYRRRVPWSMPVALVILAGLFTLVAAAADRVALTGEAARAAPHVALGRAAFGAWGAHAMMLVSALSIFTTFNAGLMGASRLVYALAREGRLPAFAARLSHRTGVPVGAVLLIAALAWTGQMLQLFLGLHQAAALACAALYCVLYAAFVAACLRLRTTLPGTPRPFRNRLPRAVQAALCLVMVGVGVAALGAESALRVPTTALFAAVLATSLGLAVRASRPARIRGLPASAFVGPSV